jgi:hypothetical protein
MPDVSLFTRYGDLVETVTVASNHNEPPIEVVCWDGKLYVLQLGRYVEARYAHAVRKFPDTRGFA